MLSKGSGNLNNQKARKVMARGTYSGHVIFKYFSCFFIDTNFFIAFFFQISLKELFQKIGASTLPSYQNFICFGGGKKYYGAR